MLVLHGYQRSSKNGHYLMRFGVTSSFCFQDCVNRDDDSNKYLKGLHQTTTNNNSFECCHILWRYWNYWQKITYHIYTNRFAHRLLMLWQDVKLFF